MTYRVEFPLQSPIGAEIRIGGRSFVNFGGSAYLGMGANERIASAAQAAIQRYGTSSPFHPTHGFSSPAHVDFQTAAARTFGTGSALFLSTGYLFGLGTVSQVRERFGAIFFDENIHYSMRDAIELSALPSFAYRHLDPEDLQYHLRTNLKPGVRPIVATDAVYSTIGKIAPVRELFEIAHRHDGGMWIDESHAYGVLGSAGQGAVAHFQIPENLVIAGGSLGKAFSAPGAMIAGSSEAIADCGRSRIGLGCSPGWPAAVSACTAAIQEFEDRPERLAILRANIAQLRRGLEELGVAIEADADIPVASFIPNGQSPGTLRQRLMDAGIHAYHSLYAGAPHEGVIRIAVFADHRREHFDALWDALRKLL